MAGNRGRRRRHPGPLSPETLLAYIRSQPERASGLHRLLDDFEADRTDRKQIKEILDQLVKDRKLRRHRGNRYEIVPTARVHLGRISVHPDGYAFVSPEDPRPSGIEGDVFVPPQSVATAMDGDRVAFTLVSAKKAEGRVVRVEERARETIVGQLRFDGRVYFVSPADSRLPEKILVSDPVSEHKDKMVEIELTRYPSEDHWPAGRIVSVIGFIDDPDVETTVVMKKYGLATHFPESVENEVAMVSTELTEADIEGRTDFRDRVAITIDPATARDFDDAVDIAELADGGFRLGVHIADVAHFVPPGSATDIEARSRGCSVYFPDRVVPMLPERLSNDICSLNPDTESLTMSVLLDITPDGRIAKSSFHQSVIRSRERMHYQAVQQILDGDRALRARHRPIVETIETLGRAARILGERRIARGTIDFDLPEPELHTNAEGIVSGIAKASRLFSHRMIEEFMIAANEAVARVLETEIRATIFRIHEPPDPERVGDLSAALAELGLRFQPRKIVPAEFQRFLSSIEGRPDEQMVSFLVLRSFRQALYSTQNQGHFGLASACYTHFTSPIRRYPDLVIHRLLKTYLGGNRRSGHNVGDLETIARTSSARERIAEAAERDLFNWKRMILLENHLGDTLDAIVISVFAKGMRIEFVDYFIEGHVSVDEMDDDYYQFQPRARTLVGRGTRRKYRLGQRIQVRVARIDKLLGRVYFLPCLASGSRRD